MALAMSWNFSSQSAGTDLRFFSFEIDLLAPFVFLFLSCVCNFVLIVLFTLSFVLK